MGVAPLRAVALRRDQDVLAEGGEVVAAERAAVGDRLAVLRRAHRPPADVPSIGDHYGPLIDMDAGLGLFDLGLKGNRKAVEQFSTIVKRTQQATLESWQSAVKAASMFTETTKR